MEKNRVIFWKRSEILRPLFFLAVMVLLLAPITTLAQTSVPDYPTKEIQLMIPFAPGGGPDLFGRTVVRVLNDEKIVNRRFQIINKPGAGAATGMAEVVRRKGDPYLLMAIALHIHLTQLTLGTPHSYKDFTPIAKIFAEENMMVVRTESPIKNLKEVEAALRKDPGSIKFGAGASGNISHISIAKFMQTFGADPTKLTYISYSGGETNAAILGGHVDVGLAGSDVMDLVEAGRIRVLGITSPKRMVGRFKDIPTFVEQGYNVVLQTWRGLFGPPEMPAYAVKYWREALTKMVQTKAWKAELEKNQWTDAFETEIFLASLEKEYEVYRSALQQLGLLKK